QRERADVADAVLTRPVALEAEEQIEVIDEGSKRRPRLALPEGRLADRDDARKRHPLVVVGHPRGHVSMWLEDPHTEDAVSTRSRVGNGPATLVSSIVRRERAPPRARGARRDRRRPPGGSDPLDGARGWMERDQRPEVRADAPARVLALGHVGEEHAGELRRPPLLDPLDATQTETDERALEDRLIEEIVRQVAGRVAVLADGGGEQIGGVGAEGVADGR